MKLFFATFVATMLLFAASGGAVTTKSGLPYRILTVDGPEDLSVFERRESVRQIIDALSGGMFILLIDEDYYRKSPPGDKKKVEGLIDVVANISQVVVIVYSPSGAMLENAFRLLTHASIVPIGGPPRAGWWALGIIVGSYMPDGSPYFILSGRPQMVGAENYRDAAIEMAGNIYRAVFPDSTNEKET